MIQKVGSYRILGTLRAGARPLYRAQTPDGRMVALKTIPADYVTPEERERFLREAQICAGLDHPNLLRVHDSGEADGILYQAMDLLEGSDLARIFAEGQQFSWDEKLSIMEQVCAGLDYAHKLSLVHRDIKPANIFLETSGHIRVLDFGMVKTSSSHLTRVGAALGTVNFMAPEQIRGEVCTAAADVFSCGIVFYQLSSGRHPFSKPGVGLPQIVSAILFDAPPPLSQIAAQAPEGLEFILNKSLHKDAARRWKDGGDFKQALALCRVTLKMLPAYSAAASAASGATAEDRGQDENAISRRVGTPPPLDRASPPIPAPNPTPARPDTPESQQIYCATCTAANRFGALTCSGCGAPLTSAPAGAPRAVATPWRTVAVVATALVLFLMVAIILLLRH